MKKVYSLALSLVIGLSASAQLTDDFESYDLGPYYGGHWGTWSGGSGGENIMIVDAVSTSGDKSGYIGGDGVQDAILFFGEGRNSGTWTFKFNVYIDFGSVGYYNLQQKVSLLGTDGNWGNQIYMGMTPANPPEYTPGTGYITGSEFYFPFEYTEETWFEIAHEVNLDTGAVKFYIDGVEIDTTGNEIGWPGGAGSFLEGADFYSADASNSMYIDDINFYEGTALGVSDVTNSPISVYPTVTSDIVNISAKSNISNIVVFNTSGQQVMTMKPQGSDAQVNVNALPAGVYIVKISAEKQTFTKKIIVK